MNEICGGMHIVQRSSKKESHHAPIIKAKNQLGMLWKPIRNSLKTQWEHSMNVAGTPLGKEVN